MCDQLWVRLMEKRTNQTTDLQGHFIVNWCQFLQVSVLIGTELIVKKTFQSQFPLLMLLKDKCLLCCHVTMNKRVNSPRSLINYRAIVNFVTRRLHCRICYSELIQFVRENKANTFKSRARLTE